MRTVNEIEKEIVALRDSSLDVHRLEFAKLFKELQVAHSKKLTGTFWARVKALGFAKTTAQRWMEEYDREVGHRKTTRDGSFTPEDVEAVSVMPNLRGKIAPALPDGKRVFLFECVVTEEEHRELFEAIRVLGEEEVKRIVLRSILQDAKRRPRRIDSDEKHPIAAHA